MGNVYLVGFMGTGKTTVGKILAQKLNKEFVETDEVIEQQEAKKIVDIFSQKGEAYFRELEKKLLEELSREKDLVVSCGGGLICNEDNLNILKRTGIVFNLKASVQEIYERTKKHTSRPLLNVDNPLEKIGGLLNKREPYYSQAHYIIDSESGSPIQIAESIIEILDKIG